MNNIPGRPYTVAEVRRSVTAALILSACLSCLAVALIIFNTSDPISSVWPLWLRLVISLLPGAVFVVVWCYTMYDVVFQQPPTMHRRWLYVVAALNLPAIIAYWAIILIRLLDLSKASKT